MNHNDIVDTLQFIRPNAEFVVVGNEVTWMDKNQTEPTIKEIQDGFVAFQTAQEKAKAEAAAKKAAAEAKLAALGLTADDLKALGLG